MKTQGERLAKLETIIPVIHESLATLNEKMDGMDHIIRGNGAPGLAQKVDSIKQRVELIEGGRNRWRDACFTVVGGVLVGVTVFLFSSLWSNHNAIPIQSVSQMQQKP